MALESKSDDENLYTYPCCEITEIVKGSDECMSMCSFHRNVKQFTGQNIAGPIKPCKMHTLRYLQTCMEKSFNDIDKNYSIFVTLERRRVVNLMLTGLASNAENQALLGLCTPHTPKNYPPLSFFVALCRPWPF